VREQWRKSGILAQASDSRLSESIRNPPRCLRELSLRWWASVFSEKPSRSGKEVSPKRENATTPLFHSPSSRLSERSSYERGNPLAWARPFSLSKNWPRMCPSLVFFSVIGCLPHVWLDYYDKAWNEWFFMYWMVYGLELMSLAWSWHVTWIGWLVINVDMELVCIMTLCWLEKTWFWCGQDVIPWIARWDLMVVSHWSGRNSTRVSWCCLIGQT